MGGSRSSGQETLWMTRIRMGQVWNEFWTMSPDKDFPGDSNNDIHDTKVPWLFLRLGFL